MALTLGGISTTNRGEPTFETVLRSLKVDKLVLVNGRFFVSTAGKSEGGKPGADLLKIFQSLGCLWPRGCNEGLAFPRERRGQGIFAGGRR